MSVYELANADLGAILLGGDNPKVTVHFEGQVSEEMPVLPQDISFSEDPDTGLKVRGEMKTLTLPIKPLLGRSITGVLWDGVEYYLASAPMPDNTLKMVTVFLTRKQTGGSRKHGFTIR